MKPIWHDRITRRSYKQRGFLSVQIVYYEEYLRYYLSPSVNSLLTVLFKPDFQLSAYSII